MLNFKQNKNSRGADKKIYTIIISIIILFSTTTVYAASEYIKLEPQAFANFTSGVKTTNQLADFLGSVFNFGIAAAVVLALIMIIWGGIIKMTTDSWEQQDEAKSKIENALYGLGLALISYIILFTINPCLVNFAGGNGCTTANTFLYGTSTPQETVSGDGTANARVTLTDTEVRNQFLNPDPKLVVTVNKENCVPKDNTDCTSLDNLPQLAITKLQAAQKSCGKEECIVVTGGTELGDPNNPIHASHGPGIATVDIRYSTDAIKALLDTGVVQKDFFISHINIFVCENVSGVAVKCDSGEVDHIHVQY